MIKLRPFQLEGVRGIYNFEGRALLADEMGLGKTIQALYWIKKISKYRPVVIVTIASMKYAWQMEAARFGLNVEVLEGTRPRKSKMTRGQIFVLNYHILKAWLPYLQKMNPRVVIFDEIHYLQNPSAQRTRAGKALSENADSVVGLSGTPMTARPIGLWSVLNIIKPNLFPDRLDYAWRFCAPKFRFGEWNFNGAANKGELHSILKKHVMIRRRKKEVAKDLPNKVRKLVPFKLSSYKEYTEAKNNFLVWLSKKKGKARAHRARRNKALVKVGYLLRLVVELRLNWTIKWIEEFVESHPDEKLVGLTMHTFVIDALRKRFPNCVVINGSVKGIRRAEAVHAFQNNKRIKFLWGNWRAAGAGITLTAASNMVELDPPFTPGDLGQGNDRIHRIGQKRDCTMWTLFALHTIEEKYVKLLGEHAGTLENILDGRVMSRDLNIFEQLFSEV